MARHRTPLAKAVVSGATINHPERFRNRRAPKGMRPLGEPYANMTEAERVYWSDFAADLPWLHAGHRVLLRLACHLAARLEKFEDGNGELGVSAT